MKMWNMLSSLKDMISSSKGNHMVGTSSSTSTKPRKKKSTSRRWGEKLEKLSNIDDCEVIKTEQFVFGKNEEFLIGMGSNGTEVYLGLMKDGIEVAVKKMTKRNLEALRHEITFLLLLDKNPSIVQYCAYAEDENFGYLALQLCEYNLEEFIKEHNPSEMKRVELAQQVLQSLRVLHGRNPHILHRDIKPQNVFIDSEGKARLADFGISRELKEGKTSLYTKAVGTTCWMAKETLVKRGHGSVRYTRSTDIQVAGMLIYYILSGGEHPFGDNYRCEGNIHDGRYTLECVPAEAQSLIEWMINADPKKRPTVEKCLAHPFFWSIQRVKHGGEDRFNPHLMKGCAAAADLEGEAILAPTTHFVDRHRRFLTENVKNVDPILDLLLEERVITVEGYSNVISKTTSLEKMRELYKLLNSIKAKDLFYKGLAEHEKLLLDELVEHGGEDRFNSPQRSVPHPEKTMASTHVDTLQGSSVNILVTNKMKLVKWLSSDLHILQHAHSDGIIDARLYNDLKNTAHPEDACIKLIDTIIYSGEVTSSEFLKLLKKTEILNTYPQLKEWSSSFALPAPPTHFVDQHRPLLIQRVHMVYCILDLLLVEDVITAEDYHNVMSNTTTQDKMRELYTLLNSISAKELFYKGLEKYEKCLLDELVKHGGEDRFNSPQRCAAAADPEELVFPDTAIQKEEIRRTDTAHVLEIQLDMTIKSGEQLQKLRQEFTVQLMEKERRLSELEEITETLKEIQLDMATKSGEQLQNLRQELTVQLMEKDRRVSELEETLKGFIKEVTMTFEEQLKEQSIKVEDITVQLIEREGRVSEREEAIKKQGEEQQELTRKMEELKSELQTIKELERIEPCQQNKVQQKEKESLLDKLVHKFLGNSAWLMKKTQEANAEQKILEAMRLEFIKSVSEPNLDTLLDELFYEKVINDREMEFARRVKDREEKARTVIDMVRRKGNKNCSTMIGILEKLDELPD